ncbi:MAG: hypothetical protein ACYS32_01430 [Planctomycetota bacterium]
MVLKYMITDDDLAEGDLGKAAAEANQPAQKAEQPEKKVVSDWRRQTIAPKWDAPSSKKNMKFWLLLMAVGIICGAGYFLWSADLISSVSDFLPTSTNKVTVTAIVYDEESASAVVSGSVVHEGDIVEGCKVVKIHADKVEFERKGKNFTKQVNQ